MVKLRQNHTRPDNPFGGLWLKVLFMLIFLLIFMFVIRNIYSKMSTVQGSTSNNIDREYLPSINIGDEIVHHTYYTLCYDEKYEVPKWVAYVLTKEDLKTKNVKRSRKYYVDPHIKYESARHGDYSNSGFTRGHMVPAGDMTFSNLAMKESFFMSNMAPQLRRFNNGVWRELEENIRDWAWNDGALYVVSGTVMPEDATTIGWNNVGVPKAFYKAIIDPFGREKKGIAFYIPHEPTERRLGEFAMTIDELEDKIELNIFENVEEENPEIEAELNMKHWKFDEERYHSRIKKWMKSN